MVKYFVTSTKKCNYAYKKCNRKKIKTNIYEKYYISHHRTQFGGPGSYVKTLSYHNVSYLSNVDPTTDKIMEKNIYKFLRKERNKGAEGRGLTLGAENKKKEIPYGT